MSHTIITIDGPAGVGKSSIAKQLAQSLGLPYLDTGAMFRTIAWQLGDGAWDLAEEELQAKLQFSFTLSGVGSESSLAVNGTAVGQEIRTETVGTWASKIASLSAVRTFLKTAQQALGEAFSLVAEGRDMGTVIFPQAQYKFFLDATPEVRADRRYLQLKEAGTPAELSVLLEQIIARDKRDRTRTIAPLKAADDAILVDTSTLTQEEVFLQVRNSVKEN